MTLRQAISEAVEQLARNPHLAPTAARDAELLLLHATALPRTALYINPARALTTEQQEAFAGAIARRLAHEPLQYITGTQEFFGLALRVTPATLIPRPETELLVEAVLDGVPHDRPVAIADVGTGSGAIAIALAFRLPEARLVAVDLSEAALGVAGENARTHGVDDRIRFTHADLLAAEPGPFDAVVANLPYVPEADRSTLHPQVREHEPPTALFAGQDGLDAYRRLIPQAANVLAAGGLLAVEFGAGQREGLANLLLTGWQSVRFLDDLQGIPRVCLARAQRPVAAGSRPGPETPD